MTSKRLTIIALGLGTLLAIADSGTAYAWVKSFSGTRNQVRTACAEVGGELIEGVDGKGIGTSACINSDKGTGVVCGDDGKCHGSGPRTASYGVLMPFGIGNYVQGSPSPSGGSLSGLGSEAPFVIMSTPPMPNNPPPPNDPPAPNVIL